MTDRLADWIALVDALYPEADAESWDATGLQVGDPADEVSTVLVALDVTEATIAEAETAGADLILAHHPLLFRPLAALTPATASGRLALRVARAGIAVLAAHTNLDAAMEGTTDPVVRILGLQNVRPLAAAAPRSQSVKLVAFVPTESTGAVISALAEAGAGVIGEYDECSFRVAGTGTFRPSAEANPVTGERGIRNEAAEDRVEMVVATRRVSEVVAALLAAHPYEEVAYDLIPLQAPPTDKGIGRVGDLDADLTLRDIAARLADQLPSPNLRTAGDLDRRIRRVAACGGAGDGLITAALASGADLYVTGDLRHHVTLDAMTQGLVLIDAGHFATEAAALPTLTGTLAAAAAERGLSARLLPSAVVTEPWVSAARLDPMSPTSGDRTGAP